MPNILKTRIVETRIVNKRFLEKKDSAIYEGYSETLKLHKIHISSLLEKYHQVGYRQIPLPRKTGNETNIKKLNY